MNLSGFELEGPYINIDDVTDKPGVYVILSIHEGKPPVVLDVGESGWSFSQGGQGIKSRLKSHNRRSCWEKHRGDGTIAFAVLYEKDGETRLRIEERLRRSFRPPCGTDPWDIRI